jgi:hypothetical protein
MSFYTVKQSSTQKPWFRSIESQNPHNYSNELDDMQGSMYVSVTGMNIVKPVVGSGLSSEAAIHHMLSFASLDYLLCRE